MPRPNALEERLHIDVEVADLGKPGSLDRLAELGEGEAHLVLQLPVRAQRRPRQLRPKVQGLCPRLSQLRSTESTKAPTQIPG